MSYDDNKRLIASKMKSISRYMILLVGFLIFFQAFFSGLNDFKGSIDGIISNSPYSLAWLSLLIILYISWVWDIAGGITILIADLTFIYLAFDNGWSGNFWILTLIVFLLVLSVLLITSSILSDTESQIEYI